ncbi:MAG: M56 family metallopeptidase, partial [Oscillospiraceae bacterium]|nr:M56 family metallopeptidase [Oscillospiraceae bacterium]
MTQLLQNAAYGTALILAAAALRKVLKDRLIPEARLALWAVCLFRLLTPAAPESVLSLWGLFRPRQAPAVSAPAFAPAPVAGTPQLYIPTQTAPSPAVPAIPWETVLLAVWLVVGGLLAARYVLSWRRTRRAVACAIPVKRDDPRYLPLPKRARLREGPMEGAPLTFGVVRPTVVLSPGLEGDTLDCVLAHEGAHASRRDNLWHYVMAITLIIHWWNPAVWLMSRLLRRDIELSCDRAAVKKLGAARRAEYANTLVSLATQKDGPAFCQTFGRKAAEERILSVMKFKKTSVIGVILSLALVLAVTVAFASAPKAPADTVEYHGQTYNRADLSQETLDWLDWYLALPEEEQLAISMVPPELIPGLTPDDYDAVRTNSAPASLQFSVSSDPDSGALKSVTINLDFLEKNLAEHVADGSMTQAEADRVLEQARALAQDGTVEWTFSPDSGLVSDRVDGQTGSPIYYKDENGNLHPVDPATVAYGFIFPAASGLDPVSTFPDDAIGGTDSATGIYTATPVPSAPL